MESRVELEYRLKLAEEALRDLEHGLNAVERTSERDERMRGDVSHLRSEFNQHVHQILHICKMTCFNIDTVLV